VAVEHSRRCEKFMRMATELKHSKGAHQLCHADKERPVGLSEVNYIPLSVNIASGSTANSNSFTYDSAEWPAHRVPPPD
jgi:hypothetical protein